MAKDEEVEWRRMRRLNGEGLLIRVLSSYFRYKRYRIF